MGKKQPSTRAGQYKQAARKRANRKRWQDVSRTAKIALVGGSGVLCVGLLGWSVVSGAVGVWTNQLVSSAYQQSAHMGFALKDVYLSGNDRLSKQAVLHHTKLHYGQPILAVSLHELQQKLEALPQVRQAEIRRQLPDKLYIALKERMPVALWKVNEKLSLLDDEGAVMGEGDPVRHRHLPLVVGKKAPHHLPQLLALLKKAPGIQKEFDSAAYVGDRRWNLWLKNGIEIKIPEEGGEQALLKLEELNQAQPLSTSEISSIDMRVPERMFIRPKIKIIEQAEAAQQQL